MSPRLRAACALLLVPAAALAPGLWWTLGAACAALVLLVVSTGWRAVPRALALGAWLVLLAGGLRLLAAFLSGGLDAAAYREAGETALRLLILFLAAGLLAGAGPAGMAGLVPGRLGRRLRARLEGVFDGYRLLLETGRRLLEDAWRVTPRKGRLTAFLRALLERGERLAVAWGEVAAVGGPEAR